MVGRTIAHYQVLEKIGEGGMGVVYRAQDLDLGRIVALKFLSPHALDDAESKKRFLREARAAASLDHANVCTVHEIGDHDGHAFLVMAYVEGHSVKEKIALRPLKLSEALDIAIQAGEGLRAAHERGIVHRDIKSANLMVTPEGTVKVMDFGLAQLAGQSGLTKSQMTLGTAAYMSPEQAQHQPVDHRSDIWSLGVVTYEMLAGRTPFEGEHEAAVLYSVIHEAPEPITALRVGVPVALDRVVGKAMAKEPGARYQHIDDMLVDLRALRKGLPVSAGVITPGSARNRRVLMAGGIAAIGLVFLLTASAIFWRARQAPSRAAAPWMEFLQLTSEPGIEWFPSLSPDGKWLVYGGASSSGHHVYLQGVGGQNRLDLTRDSTADDDQPAFSPDGEQIAFHSSREGGGIFVMGRTGEAVRRVTSVGFNPAWSPDGTQLAFSSEGVELYPQNAVGRSEVWTVAVNTGATKRICEGDAVLPSWSPHNLRIAYTNRIGTQAQGDVWTVPAAGGTPTPVTSDPARDWNPAWSPDGKYLYFASDRGGSMNLWRVPIDEASGKPRGQPEALTTPVPYLAHLSFSADGKRIAYASALITANIQQIALDAYFAPKGEPEWVTTGSRRWSDPNPSPDGEWVAFYSLTQPEGQIYVVHPDGTGLRQITSGATDRMPHWSPDGKWIACFSDRSRGVVELWKIRPDGSGQQQLTEGGGAYFAWSPDGTRIATTHRTMQNRADVGVIVFDPNRPWKEQKPDALPPLDPPTDRFLVNAWSPDGKRLAGQVNGSRSGIDVYSLETRAYQRVTDFGEWPVWLPDNRRVLFVAGGKGFYMADTLTRQVRKVYSVTRDVIGPPRLTRDGRKAYFSRRVTESDIWLCTLQ